MSEIKLTYTGGPAFPVSEGTVQFLGLSKREWFAGMALMGIISHGHDYSSEGLAESERAYIYADAMISHVKSKPC